MPISTIYYARSPNGEGQQETVAQHLRDVSSLAKEFLDVIGYGKAGQIVGSFHDFGKFSKLFAEVLAHRRKRVNHALPGAAFVSERYKDKGETARLLAAVIAAHHGCLDDVKILKRILEGTGAPRDGGNRDISLFGPKALSAVYAQLNREVDFPDSTPPELPDYAESEDPDLAYMLCARILLSALVDADYSVSAGCSDPNYLSNHTGPALNPDAALERLFALRREKQCNSKSAASLNALRDALFEDCLAAAEAPPGLFTLTAPTGLGKTLSLLAFALNHAKRHQKRRVILLLPYLALAEQNVKDYRAVIPDLLESHSAASLTEETRMLAERWSAPCIVTTTVGFFEPLFTSHATACRHLHQIANSVIVLDEAQSLLPHLLTATLRTVKELCDHYGCTFLFSTATQPSYQHLPGLDWKPREIVKDPQALFSATRRVTFDWRLDTSTPLSAIADEMAEEAQCCTIVNLRRHARVLFRALIERCDSESIFFLTTDLCLAHRRRQLELIKKRLLDGLPCRLVATTCIEAGVDVDFPKLFRALAPLEAIIQAAGRCNRNGDDCSGQVVVFLPERLDCNDGLYPDKSYEIAAKIVLNMADQSPIDCSGLSQINDYYATLYPYGSGDHPTLCKAIQDRDFPAVEENYHLIEDRGAVTIVVPYDLPLYEKIRDSADKDGLTRALMREARPITVSAYLTPALTQVCVPLQVHLPNGEKSADATGWYLLGDPRYYHPDTGLSNELPSFDGIF